MTLILPLFISFESAALAEGLPKVKARWAPGTATFTVEGPKGEHVQAEAPASGFIQLAEMRVEVEATGAELVVGIPVPSDSWRVREVEGELDLSLCVDEGTLCRIVEVAFTGTLEGRGGRSTMEVRARRSAPVLETRRPSTTRAPTLREGVEAAAEGRSPDEAFAAAARLGKPMLLDFSAVWCPPCNQMAAEVLHDPDDEGPLSPFSVVEIDVDRDNSWTLKDRYKVGGYPTVVVVHPDGAEIDRTVGYTNETAFIGFLDGVGGRPSLAVLPDLGATAPAEAASLALRLAEVGRPDEARAFATWAAQGAPDDVNLRLARMMVNPGPADGIWLCSHHPELLTRWVWGVLPTPERPLDPTLGDSILRAAAVRIPQVPAVEASDLLAVTAKILLARGQAEAARLAFLGAASTLAASLSGDLDRDRAFLSGLADLWEDAGDVDAARAVLQRGVDGWPHDPTFYLQMSRLLNDAERFESALSYAVGGLSLAWGDNHLRQVAQAARAMAGVGRKEEALNLLDSTLAAAKRPAEGQDVRTPRYIKALEDLRVAIGAS